MSVTNYEPYQPSCCSLFQWEQRVIKDPRQNTHYRVRDASGTIYTHAGPCPSENDRSLRLTFLELGLGAPLWVTLVRIPLRIFDLLTGQFIEAGRLEARKKWEVEWIKQTQLEIEKPGSSVLPTENDLTLWIALYSMRHLAIQLAQIVIYPLASIALLCVGLWGACVNTADAGKLWSTIELALFDPYYNTTSCESPSFEDSTLYRLKNIFMLCRLPEHVSFLFPFNCRLITSIGLLNAIESLVQNNQQLLTALGVDVSQFLEFVHSYRNTVLRTISPHRQFEIIESEQNGTKEQIVGRRLIQEKHFQLLSQKYWALIELINEFSDSLKSSPDCFATCRQKNDLAAVVSRYRSELDTVKENVLSLNASTVDSFMAAVAKPITQRDTLLYYVEQIEKHLVEQRTPLLKIGVKVDAILAVIRTFMEESQFNELDILPRQYIQNKRFAEGYLSLLKRLINNPNDEYDLQREVKTLNVLKLSEGRLSSNYPLFVPKSIAEESVGRALDSDGRSLF